MVVVVVVFSGSCLTIRVRVFVSFYDLDDLAMQFDRDIRPRGHSEKLSEVAVHGYARHKPSKNPISLAAVSSARRGWVIQRLAASSLAFTPNWDR